SGCAEKVFPIWAAVDGEICSRPYRFRRRRSSHASSARSSSSCERRCRRSNSIRGLGAATTRKTSAICSIASKTCLARTTRMSRRPREYPALDIRTPGEGARDLLLAILDDCRPTALEEHEDWIRAFFSNNDARNGASAALGSRFEATPVTVSDENWAERSQADLLPVTVGRITVARPWATGFGWGYPEGAV